jgi:uncharacterized protein with GYD domain
MPGYIQLYKWTGQGIANVKEAPERIRRAKEEAEKLGIRNVGIWMTMGKSDPIAVWDAPDDEAMATFTLSVAKLGNVQTQTMKAFSEDELARVVGRLP